MTDAAESQAAEADLTVYQNFNPKGTIPTFVISQKYYRIGTGYERNNAYKGLTGLEAEAQELRDVLDELINNSSD